jgi:TPR repeat protein
MPTSHQGSNYKEKGGGSTFKQGGKAENRRKEELKARKALIEQSVSAANNKQGAGAGIKVAAVVEEQVEEVHASPEEEGLTPVELYKQGETLAASDAPEDGKRAVRLYRLSAQAGYAPAAVSLGATLRFGQGTAKDVEEGGRWFQKAMEEMGLREMAEKGDAEAQQALGYLYTFPPSTGSSSVPHSKKQSITWTQKAAEQGHAVAQHTLANFYLVGSGVAASKERALEWWQKAADQGHVGAQQAIETEKMAEKATRKLSEKKAKEEDAQQKAASEDSNLKALVKAKAYEENQKMADAMYEQLVEEENAKAEKKNKKKQKKKKKKKGQNAGSTPGALDDDICRARRDSLLTPPSSDDEGEDAEEASKAAALMAQLLDGVERDLAQLGWKEAGGAKAQSSKQVEEKRTRPLAEAKEKVAKGNGDAGEWVEAGSRKRGGRKGGRAGGRKSGRASPRPSDRTKRKNYSRRPRSISEGGARVEGRGPSGSEKGAKEWKWGNRAKRQGTDQQNSPAIKVVWEESNENTAARKRGLVQSGHRRGDTQSAAGGGATAQRAEVAITGGIVSDLVPQLPSSTQQPRLGSGRLTSSGTHDRELLHGMIICDWLVSINPRMRCYADAFMDYGYEDASIVADAGRAALENAFEELQVKRPHQVILLKALELLLTAPGTPCPLCGNAAA